MMMEDAKNTETEEGRPAVEREEGCCNLDDRINGKGGRRRRRMLATTQAQATPLQGDSATTRTTMPDQKRIMEEMAELRRLQKAQRMKSKSAREENRAGSSSSTKLDRDSQRMLVERSADSLANEAIQTEKARQGIPLVEPGRTKEVVLQRICEHLYASSAHNPHVRPAAPAITIVSQERGEAEPSHEEVIAFLHAAHMRSPTTFLAHWGSYVPPHLLLALLDASTDDGDDVVRYHISLLLTDHKTRSAVVKNRRYCRMQQLDAEGEFFSDMAMKERSPWLYDQYVGKFLTRGEVNALAEESMLLESREDGGDASSDSTAQKRELLETDSLQCSPSHLPTEPKNVLQQQQQQQTSGSTRRGQHTSQTVSVQQPWSKHLMNQLVISQSKIRFDAEIQRAKDSFKPLRNRNAPHHVQAHGSQVRNGFGMDDGEDNDSEEHDPTLALLPPGLPPHLAARWRESLHNNHAITDDALLEHVIHSGIGDPDRSDDDGDGVQKNLDSDVYSLLEREAFGEETDRIREQRLQFITDAEKSVLRKEFKHLMQERFLRGEESDFVDYPAIDENSVYDDQQQIERDAQESYFGI